MSEIPVYAHRDMDGYAFIMFGDGPDDMAGYLMQSEQVERIMFEAFPDEFWGPRPSEAEFMTPAEIRDAGTLPVEPDREKLYQVGTVTLGDDGYVDSVNPFDSVVIEEYDQ